MSRRRGVGLAWLIDTNSIVAAAETYLLTTRIAGYELDAHEDCLARTSRRC